MSTETTNSNHRLFIQVGGLFKSAHEWCIVDFIYWKSNTQSDRRWTCRVKPIQQNTPVKRIETITDALDRLCERNLGFSKIPFGPPQRRRKGSGLARNKTQSFQYVFDAKRFDEWLKAHPYPKADRPTYPKTDRPLSESGLGSYPKADSRIRKKENNKVQMKSTVLGECEGGHSSPPCSAIATASAAGEDDDETLTDCDSFGAWLVVQGVQFDLLNEKEKETMLKMYEASRPIHSTLRKRKVELSGDKE